MTFYIEALGNHLGAEREVRHIGEYETLEEAIAAAQRTIDEFLLLEFRTGMSRDMLFSAYRDRGEHPFIFHDNDNTLNVPDFNHLQYALARCADLAGGKN